MSTFDETVSFSLEVNVDKAYESIRRLETVLYRSLSLLKRLSGDENIDRAITHIQELLAYINQLRLAIIALQTASGPIGWLLAGIGVASFLVTTLEFAMDA